MSQVPARFWAIIWESPRYVLTQVSVKNRREPGHQARKVAYLSAASASTKNWMVVAVRCSM
jgi:hypothetical protein